MYALVLCEQSTFSKFLTPIRRCRLLWAHTKDVFDLKKVQAAGSLMQERTPTQPAPGDVCLQHPAGGSQGQVEPDAASKFRPSDRQG